MCAKLIHVAYYPFASLDGAASPGSAVFRVRFLDQPYFNGRGCQGKKQSLGRP